MTQLLRSRVFALTLAAAAACPSAAFANVLRPATAEEDRTRARAEHDFAFCRAPPEFASKRLCALAEDVPDCDGFKRRCAKPTELSWFKALGALLAPLQTAIFWFAVAAAAAVLLVVAYMLIRIARRDRRLEDEVAGGVATGAEPEELAETAARAEAEQLLARAESFSRSGALDRALFTFLHASLRALDDRGAIRLEHHRTWGEYVRGCREQPSKAPLSELVRAANRAKFGGERASVDAVARARERATAIVRAATVTLIAFVALALTGCGADGGGAVSGKSPDGHALLEALLKNQGAHVSILRRSLTELPAPDLGRPPTAIFLDLTEVELDDDARAHLLTWVDAGGVLILAGEVASWPAELGAHERASTSHDIVVRALTLTDDGAEKRVEAARGRVADPTALTWLEGDELPLARYEDGALYAAVWPHGNGRVLGVANGDLFTNIGLAHPGNARAAIQLLTLLEVDRFEIAGLASAPAPQNPFAGLAHAGLAKGLFHALVAATLLFLAVGIRQARPRPAPPPARRAFAEHVQATGALYARTKIARHALAVYADYADARLRAFMPRSTHDPAAFLAVRTGRAPAECAALWARASAAREAPVQLAREHVRSIVLQARSATRPSDAADLATLKELSLLVSQATRR